MIKLTEDGSPVFVNPNHVVMVRQRNEGAVITLGLSNGSKPIQLIVDQAAEDIAAAIFLLYGGPVAEEDDQEVAAPAPPEQAS